MRHLTQKQKNLIANSMIITTHLIQQLEEINDYETLIQDAHRFYSDLSIFRLSKPIHIVMSPLQASLEKTEKQFIHDWK